MTTRLGRKDVGPICFACNHWRASVWRNTKPYCSRCDPYSRTKFMNENRRLRGLMKELEVMLEDYPPGRHRRHMLMLIQRGVGVTRSRRKLERQTIRRRMIAKGNLLLREQLENGNEET